LTGLFPSRNQLELLGAFLDNHASPKQLKDFWLDTMARVHGEGVRAEAEFIDEQTFFRTSFVLEYFESIQHFADNLEEFLTQIRARLDELDKRNTNKQNKQKKKKKKRGMIDYDDEDEDLLLAEHVMAGVNYVDAIDENSTFQSGPKTPLSVLFSVFRSCVELGDSRHGRGGMYFIGDLDEKRQQALILGDVPMAFKDRYTFCLAPVNVDNPEVMQAFRSMGSQFARGQGVELHGEKYVVFDNADELIEPPRSPEDLLILETLHQVLTACICYHNDTNFTV
jgi:hypothetical protein